MAKVGYLYLHQGSWDGERIMPSSWVDRIRQGPVTATEGYHYANFWWSLPDRGAFMARGRHSQIILVLPNLDVVAVLTGVLRDDEDFPMTRPDRRYCLCDQVGRIFATRFRRRIVACRIDSKSRR
jgi:CubicO group peptidase (beta-lactamase class C family)